MSPNTPKKSFKYETVLFYFAIVVLVCVAGAYFYMVYAGQKMEEEAVALDATLAKQKTPQQKALELDVLSNQRRMQDFPVLLSAHKVSSEFFRRLEALTHPNIVFTTFKFNPGQGTATVSGSADNFESLAQQLAIFAEASNFAKSVDLAKISLSGEGKVDFTFNITVDSGVLAF